VCAFQINRDLTPAPDGDVHAANARSIVFSMQALLPLFPSGGGIVVTRSINTRHGMAGTPAYASLSDRECGPSRASQSNSQSKDQP